MLFSDVIGQEEVKHLLRLSVEEGRIPHAQLFTGPTGAGKLPLALAYAQYIACNHHVNTHGAEMRGLNSEEMRGVNDADVQGGVYGEEMRGANGAGAQGGVSGNSAYGGAADTHEEACGKCATCVQFGQLQHPDLHFAFPIVKTDNGDTCNDFMSQWRQQLLTQPYFDIDDWYRTLGIDNKQGLIYEKESSEILRKLSLKSFADGYKFMIIWQPEKMNESCANKLLKLIEEPPEKTLFLLVSEQPERLLPTIVSRCQEIRVPRLDERSIAAALMERYEMSATEAQDTAHIANGSMTAALHIAAKREQNNLFFADFVALMRNAWRVGQRKEYNALIELRQWSIDIADGKVGRERQKAFLQYVQRQIRENYIANFRQPAMNYQTTEERDFSSKFSRFISDRNVERIMDELSKAEMQISQNGNAKIIFFDLCLQMIVLIK